MPEEFQRPTDGAQYTRHRTAGRRLQGNRDDRDYLAGSFSGTEVNHMQIFRNGFKGRLTGMALVMCVALTAAGATLAAGPRGGAAPKTATKEVDPKASKAEAAAKKKKKKAGGSEPEVNGTGRLTLTILDQDGKPLERANVDLRSNGPGFYRDRGTTDTLGRIAFNSVPMTVNISVTVQNGFLSQDAQVPQSGTADFRLTVQVYEAEQAPAENPANPADPTAGGA
jgi:hypothetical protein